MTRTTSTMEAFRNGFPFTVKFGRPGGFDKDLVKSCLADIKNNADCDCQYVVNPKSVTFCFKREDYDYVDSQSINNKINRIARQYLMKG